MATVSISSISSIKSELDRGQLVIRERQTGKTTALLEWVREHDPANMIVVCGNWNMRELARRRYCDIYPCEPQPIFQSVHSVSDRDVCGTMRKWVTDEVWPRAVMLRAFSYVGADYCGGVGTPMCMDNFSGMYLTYAENEKPELPQLSESPVFMQVSDGRTKKKGKD